MWSHVRDFSALSKSSYCREITRVALFLGIIPRSSCNYLSIPWCQLGRKWNMKLERDPLCARGISLLPSLSHSLFLSFSLLGRGSAIVIGRPVICFFIRLTRHSSQLSFSCDWRLIVHIVSGKFTLIASKVPSLRWLEIEGIYGVLEKFVRAQTFNIALRFYLEIGYPVKRDMSLKTILPF